LLPHRVSQRRGQPFASAQQERDMSLAISRADAVTAVTYAGTFVRYAFYAVALLVLTLVGLGIMVAFSYRQQVVQVAPAFRLAAPELNALAARTEVITSGRIGRAETRHYGQLYDRDRDLTVVMVTPPKDSSLDRDFVQEVRTIAALRNSRVSLLPTYYDLQTRFGSVRAAEMHADVDGQRKLCLAFLSRFDTPAVYLKGWLCEASGVRASPDGLACLLNRLVLDIPLADGDADAFMRARIARPGACWAAPVTQTTDTRPPRRPPPAWRR
jgi:hypothetical protein